MYGKIIVGRGGSRCLIPLGSIVYMEKMGRRMRIVTTGGDHVCYGRFGDMDTDLDERFMRIHRSYIINMDMVESMLEGHINMEGGASVYFGRDKFREAVRTMDSYHMKKGKN